MNLDEVKEVLRPLRLQGAHVIAHSSLAAFGNVEGGAVTVCQALMQSITEAGTLLMPAFTYDETLLPPGGIRTRALSYHLDLPVSREIGAIPEAFRRLPGVVRSSHPTHSFAAWGRQLIKRSFFAHLIVFQALIGQLPALTEVWAYGSIVALIIVIAVQSRIVRSVRIEPLQPAENF